MKRQLVPLIGPEISDWPFPRSLHRAATQQVFNLNNKAERAAIERQSEPARGDEVGRIVNVLGA